MSSNLRSPLVRLRLGLLALPAMTAALAILSLWHPDSRHFGPYFLLVLAQVPLLGIAVRATLTDRNIGPALGAIAGLWLSTFLLPVSEPFIRPGFAGVVLHLTRIGCPVFVLSRVIGVKDGATLAAAGLAALLASVSICDYALLALSLSRPAPTRTPIIFRQSVELSQVSSDDVVVIGDSMTYGAGVQEGEAFPAVMNQRWRTAGLPGQVLNLGVGGAAMPEYVEVLKQVTRKHAAIVCFYPNDMPERLTPQRKWRTRLANMSRASGVARLGLDVFNRLSSSGDVNKYLATVIADFDRSDSSYTARWQIVTRHIAELGELGAIGARRRPIFVIFPIMWKFSDYPLRQAHVDLAEAATAAGFEVIDMLPVFERDFPDGKKYLVAPNDNHYNAVVYRRVGETIFEVLTGRQ
jgi:hypothetical protein